MNVLVLGGGGREHALAWRIAQGSAIETVYLHPGNAGTRLAGFPPLSDAPDLTPAAIARHCKQLSIPLVVIGPEAMLAQGLADQLRSADLAVVGPGIEGARLESSKAFAKEFMRRAGVPTARHEIVHDPASLRAAVTTFPVVLKLDGLAAGKGVVVATSRDDVDAFIERVWTTEAFGSGPHAVLVEQFLEGREVSYIGLCDGRVFLPFSSASDYKRVGEGNTGANTGGMGCISPSPLMNPALEKRIEQTIVLPTLTQLQSMGIVYRGALYFGLMVTEQGEPYVLEFNARFGDPETKALMLRLQGDFASALIATAHGRLSEAPALSWSDQVAIYVVGAARGYPEKPHTGDPIQGLNLEQIPDGVFFSGVASVPGGTGLVTHGGRVLGVGALGPDIAASRRSTYQLMDTIQWEGKHFRRDIGVTSFT